MTQAVSELGGRRAWAVWSVGLAVYLLAVCHRSSLGVAGLLAADRFDVRATELAMFTVLQLLVYAGMQIPVGVLLDRYGARLMLLAGLAMMTTGQLAFAFATDLVAAVLARGLLGAGDAMVFVSVLRLVGAWFTARRVPMVTQLTGQVGQLGAIAAAGPLGWALHELGWTPAFALVAAIGVPLLVAVAVVVADSPVPTADAAPLRLAALTRSLRLVWGNPGTRLGMWSHFSSQFSMIVFSLLWGFPFLVAGEGVSTRTAAGLLMLMTAWMLVAGLVLGNLTAWIPYHRSHLVLGVVGLVAAAWTAVLVWPGPAPLPLLVVLVLATACGGPASMVGFDLARTFTPQSAAGRANGLVNIGGFGASLLTMALIGLVLDLRQPGGGSGLDGYAPADFTAAMSVQYLFWTVGAVQILRYRRKALAHLDREHPGAVETLKRGEPFVHPGFSDTEGV